MSQALAYSKVSFWLHATDRGLDKFRGSGMVVGDQHILTAKHLLYDEAGDLFPLWASAAINATTSQKIEDVQAHPTLDIALARVSSFPARVRPASLNRQGFDSAKAIGFTVTGFLEGGDDEPQVLEVTQYSGQERHFLSNVKHPPGYSGGAICVANAVWAVLTSHYKDPNTHRGCAVAVHQFWDWLEPLLPPSAPTGKEQPLRCPPGHSPVQVALWDALFTGQPTGWESMHGHGLARLFDEAAEGRGWAPCASSPQQFFQFCVGYGLPDAAIPFGAELLSCLSEVLEGAAHPGATLAGGLPEPARRVLVALCSVGIERWAHAVVGDAAHIPVPDAGGVLRLALEDEWAVYLLAAAKFSLRTRLTPDLSGRPPGLITIKAPVEPKHGDHLSPVRSAVVSALYGRLMVDPSDTLAKLMLPALRKKLQTDLLLGYKSGEAHNPLSDPANRKQAWTEFEMPVTEYGDAGGTSPAAPSAADALKAFSADLRGMIEFLNEKLNPPSDRPAR